MSGTVLILTEHLDPTADLVVAELHRREVPVFRCDVTEFPERLALTAEFDGAWRGSLRGHRRTLDLSGIRSAYYRRPGAYTGAAGLRGTDGAWAAGEAESGLGGLLQVVPDWFNHPHRTRYAEYKPVQLAAAARAGLTTPRTLLTSDPAAASRFVAAVGKAVYKPFSSRVDGPDGRVQFIYTSVVDPAELPDRGVAGTAHLFQAWVDKDYDVRLTVVDDRFFAARVSAGSPAAFVDWRSDYPAVSYATIDTPGPVRHAVRRMLTALGLRFAALDFAVTRAGEWYFLDLNPNGQWAWIEHHTGLPICAAIADALTHPPQRNDRS